MSSSQSSLGYYNTLPSTSTTTALSSTVSIMGSQGAISQLNNIARAALGLGIATMALSSSLYIIDGGQRTVIFDRIRGILDETVGKGIHFLIPWLQKLVIFDIHTKPHTFSSVSSTRDLQMVNLTLRVLSRPEVTRLPQIVQTLGLKYDEKVLPSIGNEVLKTVMAPKAGHLRHLHEAPHFLLRLQHQGPPDGQPNPSRSLAP
ncbi:hypothetical protein SO802_009951 [Lithocarpus litseifolius]|uniref:Prohibitin n=1 Tax=Lithocarpus litseifolius TaxID=425828 RepID=A0AAW2DE92_9ROSI